MNHKLNIDIFIIIIILLLASQAPATDVSQDEIAPRMKEHSWRILERLNWLQNEGKLYDVTIIVGNRSFRAHKLVLSAGSPYFEAMFANGNMKESVSTDPITLHDLDAEAFEMMKNYIYTGRITIDDSTVQRQLAGASYLQMTNVKADCCAYMKEKLNARNCLGIKYIADIYSCADLLQSATVLALDAFEDVVLSEEFLELPPDQLISIISEDSLNVSSEEEVYEAAMRWIRYKNSHDDDRIVRLPDILQHVRFSQMDPSYLKRVSKDPMIRACEKCREYVNYLRFERNNNDSSIETRFKPRKTNYLFAVGGCMNDESTSSVDRYDPKTNKWTEVASMISSREYLGVAALNNKLYAVGGIGVSYLRSVECYDPHTDKWTDNVKPLEHGRDTYNLVAALNGILYVIGGFDSSRSSLQSVVKYDPDINEWIECKPLRQKRYHYAVAALADYIYVLGGFVDHEVLNIVERYDPTQNEWYDVSPMITKRCNLGSTAHRDDLYAVGGHGEDGEILNSVEKYSTREQKWELISPMTEHRYDPGLAVANRLIYAVGGNEEDLHTVEVYDPEIKVWTKRAPMLKARSYFALAAMKF